ncbi:MAG: hypothetical protein ACQEUT_18400 [Bacillota bacterium]
MDFLSKLVESEETKKLRKENLPFFRSGMGMQSFNGIEVSGGVRLSIQASFYHYSTPRATLPVGVYTAMEMAIIKDGRFASASEVSSNPELFGQLDEYFDGSVFGYVPVELIEQLYQELKAE